MLYNARSGDFVDITNRESKYFGMIGRIKKVAPEILTVEVYGKDVDIPSKDLYLRARAGTGIHDELTQQVSEQGCNNLDEDGYTDLINLAIDMQEWGWATELVERKNNFLANKRR